MVESEQVIVIDNGSAIMKAGIGGEEAPRAVFPSIVGRPIGSSAMQGVQQKSEYLGDEAMANRGILDISYPVNAGIVESWDDMEKVWRHTFEDELRVDPAQALGVLITEAPHNPKQNREKMTSIMFDIFGARKVHIALAGVMALYAAGRITGLVCDIGDGVTSTIPIFGGFHIPHAIGKT